MEQRNKNKSNQAWWLVVKIFVAGLAAWFIYRRIFEKENIQILFDEYRDIFSAGSKTVLVGVIFLLMFLNWTVEALKWRMMIGKIERISFLKSLEAVFSGLTVSFFTPNRIGEYAGRVFHLKSADRVQAILITVIENFSQLLVTILAGSAGLVFYLHLFTGINDFYFVVVVILTILFMCGGLLIFLNVSFFKTILCRFSFLKSLQKYFEIFGYFSYRELTKVILLAAIRYFIFTSQFYLLLILFDVHIYYPVAILLVSMIFYVMSVIPTIALTEIGVRGAVAVYFLGHVTDQSVSVLNSTVSLWLINLAIPALIGVVFIFKFRLKRRAV